MPDTTREPLLDPEDDARIRRLLAEARHTEPVPAPVAARLDRVLADLSARRAAESAQDDRAAAEVVDLAARRRRTAGRLLIAAAAVVVAGVGVGHVLGSQGGGSDTAAEEATSQTDADAPAAASGESGGSGEDSAGGDNQYRAAEDSAMKAAGEVVTIRADHFSADIRKARARALAEPLPESPAPSSTDSSTDSSTESSTGSSTGPSTGEASGEPDATGSAGVSIAPEYAAEACPIDSLGPGEALAASYDGVPAVVMLREPTGDVQVVDLYICGTTEPARSITLTAP